MITKIIAGISATLAILAFVSPSVCAAQSATDLHGYLLGEISRTRIAPGEPYFRLVTRFRFTNPTGGTDGYPVASLGGQSDPPLLFRMAPNDQLIDVTGVGDIKANFRVIRESVSLVMDQSENYFRMQVNLPAAKRTCLAGSNSDNSPDCVVTPTVLEISVTSIVSTDPNVRNTDWYVVTNQSFASAQAARNAVLALGSAGGAQWNRIADLGTVPRTSPGPFRAILANATDIQTAFTAAAAMTVPGVSGQPSVGSRLWHPYPGQN